MSAVVESALPKDRAGDGRNSQSDGPRGVRIIRLMSRFSRVCFTIDSRREPNLDRVRSQYNVLLLLLCRYDSASRGGFFLVGVVVIPIEISV